METSRTEWMLIGRIAGPFGVRGEAKVEGLTDFPDRFRQLKRVFLGPEHRSVAVENCRLQGSRPVLKLAGIDSPEAVKSLGTCEVAVPRDQAVALPAGHYYLDDLLGMNVSTVDGEGLGTVVDVIRTGSNDVYVVEEGQTTVLVPAITDAVNEIDFSARRIVVEGWASVRQD
jgi:16S rRNA processing protein RimM